MIHTRTYPMRAAFTAVFFGVNALLSAINALAAFFGDGQAGGFACAFAWSSAFLGWSMALVNLLALHHVERHEEGADQ